MPTRLLTVDEVAEILHENPQTTRRRIRQGQLTGVRLPEGARTPWRVTERSLQAFIERRTTAPVLAGRP